MPNTAVWYDFFCISQTTNLNNTLILDDVVCYLFLSHISFINHGGYIAFETQNEWWPTSQVPFPYSVNFLYVSKDPM